MLVTGILTANGHKKPPTRYRIGGRKYIVSCALCADLQNANALDTAALALERRMNVQLQRRFDVRMTQHFADAFDVRAVFDAPCSKRMPLRYNYDKPEKPRISRVFGYLARFFILFQTEKSSREVVIS